MARSLREAPLPRDVGILLRLLAREPEAEVYAASETGKSVEMIREATEFYVTQVMLQPGTDPLRLLGGRPGTGREELRTNLGYLLRWAHPDLAHSNSRNHYFQRVIGAWEAVRLRQPDRDEPIETPSSRKLAIRVRPLARKRLRRRLWFRSFLVTGLIVASAGASLLDQTIIDPPEWLKNWLESAK